jgi:hypothetical protein
MLQLESYKVLKL